MTLKFKHGDWVIAKRSQSIAQIISIDFFKKEYYVEYSNQNGQIVNYDTESFENHWELYSSSNSTVMNLNTKVCDCGTVSTFGSNAPKRFHSYWCTLIKNR